MFALFILGSPCPAAASSAPLAPARAWLADTWRPLPTPRSLAILATGAALGAACTGFEDADASARALEHGPLHALGTFGNAYGELPVISGTALLLYGAGRWSGHTALRETGFDAMRALAVTGATVGVLKVVVKRERPDGGRHSFPSGHAAATMALAPVVTRHLGWRFGAPAYALALFTGMGRIQDRRHHLSDVVWGSTLGLTAGIAASQPRSTTSLSYEPFVSGDRIGCALHF